MNQPRFASRTPEGPLNDAVRLLLFSQGPIHGNSEKVLPHDSVALGLNLGAPHAFGKGGKSDSADHRVRFSGSWLSGLQTTPLYHFPSAASHAFGALFDPLAFSEMFPQDMGSLKERTVEASEALGTDRLARLLAVCQREHEVEERLGDIERLLRGWFADREPHPDWLWTGYREMRRTTGAVRLETLYDGLEVSGRYFNQRFQKATGLSPKAFCRVLRLRALLEAIDPNRQVNWTALAHDFGYSDQSHFNRDFRLFTGMTPSRYVVARAAVYGDLEAEEAFVPETDDVPRS